MFGMAVVSLVYLCVSFSFPALLSKARQFGDFPFDSFPVVLPLLVLYIAPCPGQQHTVLPWLETAAPSALCVFRVHVVNAPLDWSPPVMAAWEPLPRQYCSVLTLVTLLLSLLYGNLSTCYMYIFLNKLAR